MPEEVCLAFLSKVGVSEECKKEKQRLLWRLLL